MDSLCGAMIGAERPPDLCHASDVSKQFEAKCELEDVSVRSDVPAGQGEFRRATSRVLTRNIGGPLVAKLRLKHVQRPRTGHAP
jgi:hypothetical protein